MSQSQTPTTPAAPEASTVSGAPVPPPARHAWALAACGLTLLCGLVWAALAVAHPDADVSYLYFYDGGLLALGQCYALFGAFLVVNRKATGLGAVLIADGLLRTLSSAAALAAALAGATGPALDLVMAVMTVFWIVNNFLVMAFPLWLPDGRLPRGPARALVAATGVTAVALGYYSAAGSPGPYGLDNPLQRGAWGSLQHRLTTVLGSPGADVQVALHVFTGFIVVNLLVALVRWRRSPGPHPRLAEAVLPYLVWATVATLPWYLHIHSTWATNVLPLAGPGAWLLGLLAGYRRDRSLSLDRATLRCLGAYTLSASLYIVVLTAVYLVHELAPGVGRGGTGWTLSVLAALAVGVLLRPAAHRVFRAVDRYYYGERAHPYQVARDLAEQLRLTVDPADAPTLLCRTVVGALGMPAAAVRVDARGGRRELAALGAPGDGGESFPLSYEGAPIGDLYVSPRAGQSALDRQDREVLRLLADQASPAIASLRLYEDLQTSRKQLVLAREEERRRLRHDLHDGLGPALSGLRLQVDAARSGLPADSAPAAALSSASSGIGQAITELRRITDGLAPAALGSEGLAGALRQLADRLGADRLRISLDLAPQPLPPLPAAVEVAVYRISGEALNNVVRHSGATDVRLLVRVGPDEVTVEAQDNGAGFPAHTEVVGVGLRSMAERAEELGGSFSAANDPRGAVVRAVLPRLSAADQPG